MCSRTVSNVESVHPSESTSHECRALRTEPRKKARLPPPCWFPQPRHNPGTSMLCNTPGQAPGAILTLINHSLWPGVQMLLAKVELTMPTTSFWRSEVTTHLAAWYSAWRHCK